MAALDLEIRGAGNLLGGEQSGTIDAVGFEMYMKLLEETIRELKGEDLEDDMRATVNLKVDFRLDESYVPDMNQRLMIYRRMAGARSEDEIGRIVDEVRDRYGPPPTAVLNLADFGADSRARRRPGRRDDRPRRLDGRDQVPPEGQGRSDAPHRAGPGARRPEAGAAEHGEARPQGTGSAGAASRRARQPKLGAAARLVGLTHRRPAEYAKIQRKPSWWTARATTGEVTPGFTKAEILKQAPEDPRAPTES